MSSSQQPSERSKLDEYLDGTMPAQEREEFAREIAANPQLKAEIELQNQINHSLSQHYLPPILPANLGQILKDSAPSEITPSSGAKPNPYLNVGLALTAVIGIWSAFLWSQFKPAPNVVVATPQIVELVSPYQKAVATGFQPATVLSDSKTFTKVMREHFGKGLRIKTLPQGCKILGVTQSHSCGCSGFPVTIYAQVDGKPVMIFVKTAANDIPPEQPSTESKLKLFRKEITSLVLYEVTPHEKAKAIDLFELADETPKQ